MPWQLFQQKSQYSFSRNPWVWRLPENTYSEPSRNTPEIRNFFVLDIFKPHTYCKMLTFTFSISCPTGNFSPEHTMRIGITITPTSITKSEIDNASKNIGCEIQTARPPRSFAHQSANFPLQAKKVVEKNARVHKIIIRMRRLLNHLKVEDFVVPKMRRKKKANESFTKPICGILSSWTIHSSLW